MTNNEKVKNDIVIKKMTDRINKQISGEDNVYIKDNFAIGHVNNNISELLLKKQPLCYQHMGSNYVITYDGELYNSNELKKELENFGFCFNNASDAEIVLASYIVYKEKCLEKLDGVFSFAIFSQQENMLFLARDRLGIKPLFYTIVNNTIVFGTEIKGILNYPSVKASVGEKEIMELIGLGPAHSPGNTYFKNIHEIKAGYFATYSNINFNTFCYWDLKTNTCEDDIYTAISTTKELVTDSLTKQITSNIPVCCMLSGGLDSSILTALAKDKIPNLSTFSIDFVDNDSSFVSNAYQPTQDAEFVKIMSDFLSTNHKTIYFNNKDLFNLLEDSMIARDMPGMSDIDSSMYAFCKAISDTGFKVCLSGECSDEIFGGYPWYYKEKLVNYPCFPWALSDDIRNNIVKSNTCINYEIKEYIKECYNNTLQNVELNSSNEIENKFRKTNYLTIKWFMNTLLERTERASKANGLNVRVPFADYKIFEYIYNIPAKYKLGLIHNNEPVEKYLLRKAFESKLPREVVYRKKSPFPKTYATEYLNLVESEIRKILDKPSQPIHLIVNSDYIKQILDSHGKNLKENWFGQLMTYPQMLSYLIQINMWLKEYNINIEI